MTRLNDPHRDSSPEFDKSTFPNIPPTENENSDSSDEAANETPQNNNLNSSSTSNGGGGGGYGYYQLLPQNENQSNNVDQLISDDDESETSSTSEDEDGTSANIADSINPWANMPPTTAPSDFATNSLYQEAERERLEEETSDRQTLFNQSSGRNDIKIDEEAIKNAMASIQLPTVPPWAKDMSDDDWKNIFKKKNDPK